MSRLLTSGETGNLTSEQLKKIKESSIDKWTNLGFLSGLTGHIREDIAKLYESGPSTLLVDEPWFVYILCCSDGTFYTGITNDVQKRLDAHNNGKGAKYTRGRTPVSMRYIEEYPDKSSAAKEEYRIKQLTKLQKLELIGEWTKRNF